MIIGGIEIERGVAGVMRDGTVLVADVYRPIGTESYPVLLMRQPYGRTLASTVTYAHPIWFAKRGYIVAIQDVRGRGDSQGSFEPFVHDKEDGYDSVQWAASLPGSNGKVGMYGFSFQGTTQWAAAASAPPALMAIAPVMCAADLYSGMFYPHGRFAIGSYLPWAFQLARDEARRQGDAEAERQCTAMMAQPGEWLRKWPLVEEHPLLSRYFPTYYDWVSHPTADAYWQAYRYLPAASDRVIPSLHIGGWFDNYLHGTLQSFEAMLAHPASSSRDHRLIIGPWMHIPWGRRAGGRDYGEQAALDLYEEHVRWFDYWLKGEGDISQVPTVRYYELESGQWCETMEHPFSLDPEQTDHSSDWRLVNQGRPANGAGGGGMLQAEADDRIMPSQMDVLVYDARLTMACQGYLPEDRSGIEDRQEQLNYTTAPLSGDLRLAGAPVATVRAISSQGPSDLVAVLTMISPEGSSQLLSIGRTEIPASDPEIPDDWQEITIKLRPCASLVRAGWSLRLSLGGSAFPLFVQHPNGVSEAEIPWQDGGSQQMAFIAVAVGGDRGTRLRLPLA